MPPPELRDRVLAAVRAEPMPSRVSGSRRAAVVLAAGLLPSVALSVYVGGPSTADRPVGFTVAVTLAWLGIAAVATLAAFSRGTSMLGRPASYRLAVATFTPVALLAASLVAALFWPETLADHSTMRDHVVCIVVTFVCSLGPLAAFAVLRRRSEPLMPRLTGAALGAAAGGWAAVTIELHCGHAAPDHVIAGHLLPVALVTLVGVLVGDGVLAIRAKHG